MSLGLLVYGDNHLVLRGPRPAQAEAWEIVAHFGLSMAQIRPQLDRSGEFREWRISVREFREELAWAVVLPAGTGLSPAVKQLLDELVLRPGKIVIAHPLPDGRGSLPMCPAGQPNEPRP